MEDRANKHRAGGVRMGVEDRWHGLRLGEMDTCNGSGHLFNFILLPDPPHTRSATPSFFLDNTEALTEDRSHAHYSSKTKNIAQHKLKGQGMPYCPRWVLPQLRSRVWWSVTNIWGSSTLAQTETTISQPRIVRPQSETYVTMPLYRGTPPWVGQARHSQGWGCLLLQGCKHSMPYGRAASIQRSLCCERVLCASNT